MSNSGNSSSEIDKEALYGEYLKGQRWRERLQRRVTHKALDEADDDMDFRQNIRRGMGWPELLVVGLILVSGIVGTLAVFRAREPIRAPVAPPASQQDVPDSEYEIRFYDAEGNLIEVPHIKEIRK